jgi:hypothetical protein
LGSEIFLLSVSFHSPTIQHKYSKQHLQVKLHFMHLRLSGKFGPVERSLLYISIFFSFFRVTVLSFSYKFHPRPLSILSLFVSFLSHFFSLLFIFLPLLSALIYHLFFLCFFLYLLSPPPFHPVFISFPLYIFPPCISFFPSTLSLCLHTFISLPPFSTLSLLSSPSPYYTFPFLQFTLSSSLSPPALSSSLSLFLSLPISCPSHLSHIRVQYAGGGYPEYGEGSKQPPIWGFLCLFSRRG